MKTHITLAFAAVALLCGSVTRAADTFRLDRMGIVRFSPAPNGRLVKTDGVLFVDGTVQWRASFEMDRPAGTPPDAIGRNLIATTAWLNYHALGTGATSGFTLTDGAVAVLVGDEYYRFIAPNPEGIAATGKVINISTRARVTGANDAVIAGFVIEGRPRKVLIRGVGPGLRAFGVTDPLVDPRISLLRSGQAVATNDNWHQGSNADEIRSAALMVGAFPLDESSADSAILADLTPGAYTVHLEPTANAASGAVLVEVYSVPEV